MSTTQEDLKAALASNTPIGDDIDSAANQTLKAAQDNPLTLASKSVIDASAPKVGTGFQQKDFSKPNPAMTDQEEPDFGTRFRTNLGDLMKLKSGIGLVPAFAVTGAMSLGGGPQSTGAPEAPSLDDQGEKGNVNFDQATSNADQTQPTGANLPKPQDKRAQAVGNALESFAAGAGAEGSPFNAISKNIEAQHQQQKDAITNAHVLAQTLHEQALVHQLGEEQVAKAATTGQGNVDMLLHAQHPGELRAQGKTSDEIKNMIATGKIDTKLDSVNLTGRQQVGTDKNGQPMFRSTYTVVRPGGPVTFDGDTNEDERNFINEKLGFKKGDPQYIAGPEDDKPGQTLPAMQVNKLYKQAQVVDANQAAAEESLSRNNQKRLEAQKDPDTQKLMESTLLSEALTKTAIKGDPADPDHLVKAYNYLTTTGKDLLVKDGWSMPRFEQAFKNYAAHDDPKGWDTMLSNYQKTREKLQTQVINQLTTDKAIKEPEGTAAAAQLQIHNIAEQTAKNQAIIDGAKKNPNDKVAQDQAAEAQVDNLRLNAETQRVSDLHRIAVDTLKNKEEQKQKEAEAAEQGKQNVTANQDFPNDLEAALRYDIDPEKLFGKNRSSALAQFMEKVQAEAKKRGTNWSEGEYKARYKTTQDFAPGGKYGASIISLGNFTRHSTLADDNINQLWNTKSEWLNKPITAFYQSVEGKSNAAKMRVDLTVAADEWMKFINGTTGLTNEDKAVAAKLVNENSSPQVIHDILKEMADTVAARSASMNDAYKETFNKDYPKMFTTQTADLLKNHYNIDVRNMDIGKVYGENQTVAPTTQQTNTPTAPKPPATHVFDVSKYQGKNLKGDIARAKSMGYDVINEAK